MKNMQRMLNLRFIGWFFIVNALLFLILGADYFKSIIQCTTLFRNLVFDYSSLPGKVLVTAFIVTTFFSYMVFLAFIPASIVFATAFFIRKRSFIFVLSTIIATLSLFLLVIDTQIYSMFKFHINRSILDMMFSLNAKDVFDLSSYEIVIIGVVALCIFLLECVLAWLVWKFIVLRERYKIGKSLTVFWLGSALFSYFTLMLSISVQHNNLLIQQAANLPFYNTMLSFVIPKSNAKDLLNRFSEGHYMQAKFSGDKFNYPLNPMRCMSADTSTSKPYNIIFIMVDSLRFDALKHMPSTSNFASQNWNFVNNISGGNSTQPGLFTLFYSIPSSYWTAALEQKVAPVFIDLLLDNNYKTQVYWSSEMHNPPMHKTIYNKLPNLDINGVAGNDLSNWDRVTTTKAVSFLDKVQNESHPFFLNVFYNGPHAFCRSRDFPIKYKPISKECSRISMRNSSDPRPYVNSYLNTVDFVDGQIDKLLKNIEKNGYLENSIIIITSDHGQEFNENHQNYWGHASNYSSYQVHVPLIIHWPHDKPREISTITSGYDLMPTLFSRLFNCKNDFSDYSIGHDLLDTKSETQFVLSGSYVNSCIIERDRLTTLHLSGEITITDLLLNPIPDAKPRTDIFNSALSMMRQYYF
ncbi:MAG: DUF3413 domain-containing protein [Legionellaceae bacterium]|nr:DUF3413 domain-containing protein [Legionellaceae bacterium]